ncbi:MAG: TIGR04100 family radical SAM protein [Terrisporobacter othiniensis]|uniref:TIGR04100 family radical SAM protein n=1 Tax=Terrisporobacter petrolearius TaxID=1460447 RepID=UPI0022E8125A|nr:TIGR04100 family radical SAM protein [Terrisporobacter petrolearius]MDU4861066.1 TIGR04100 family radical SAM protein [Terrisporobacter othiniensis]MDU6993644.1 TIGR04100 family radical SAM protein [Terrisporobacter othiniensis]
MTILYDYKESLYVNITNKCPCSCVFCIRKETDHVGNSDSLWLDHEPTVEEVKNEFKKFNLENYDEIVFCGYGEPLVRINEVIEIAKYIRSISDLKIRINTNGLSDLIHNKKTAILLKDKIDSVSISLNAPNKIRYNEVTKPKFGEKSFDALLNFAKDCKEYIEEVNFSVVDEINNDEIEEAQKLADKMNIVLRVRHKN